MNKLYLYFLLLILLFALVTFPKCEIEVTYSEPLVLETSTNFMPADSYLSKNWISGYKVGSNTEHLLVLYEVEDAGIWYAIRTEEDGRLIDTIPNSFRTYEDILNGLTGFDIQEITWKSPYFYVWEKKNNELYYTRLNACGEKEDLVPVLFIESIDIPNQHSIRFVFDSDKVWTIGIDYFFKVGLFKVGLSEPIFNELILPTKGARDYYCGARNALFMAANQPADSVLNRVAVTESGEIITNWKYPMKRCELYTRK